MGTGVGRCDCDRGVGWLAPDPFWEADDQETAVLDYTDSVANANRALQRINGQWQALGTGFNGTISDIQVDTKRGRIYFCGLFTTANGITVNQICYWDGSTFVAMGKGVTVGQAFTIAIAANGDVHVGGAFTTVDGVAGNNYYARWNFATSTWTAFGAAIPTGPINAIKIKPSNQNIYLAGNFTNWNANANADYIVSYDGTTWSALGSATLTTSVQFHGLDFDASENLYIGAGAILRKWDGTNWTTLVTVTGGSAEIYKAKVIRNGNVIYGGDFTSPGNNIALWNGSTSIALGTGTNGAVYDVEELSDGKFAVSGNFTTAGDLALADRIAYWNSYTWTHPDIDLPGTPVVYALREWQEKDLFIGYTETGTATAAGLTTITNGGSGSTAAYPRLSVINGNSSRSFILHIFSK